MLCLRLCLLSALSLCCVFDSSFLMIDALAACRPDKIQALEQFKSEFNSRGCNHSDYLNGVKCDNTTGAVTKLQLPHGCLSGILKPNSSLFGLHHLRYLDLSHNDFTSSSLPSQFGNLKKLEVLSLSSNGFIGQVPSSISNLSFLTHLNLSHNELAGDFPLIRNLTKLSTFDISHNHISGIIPSSLLTMPFLSYLDLTKNQLTAPIVFPNSSSSSRLERLFLRYNLFEGNILEPISKLINLKYLDMSFLNINYPIDLSLFSSLESLLSLDLSGNRLLAASIISVDSDMPSNLTDLVFSGCDITEFPSILKNLQNLQHLDISNNRIKGKVPEWLWNLPHLKIVTLVNNSLDGFKGSMESLVDSSVQILELGFNSFKGSLPSPPLSINILSAPNNSFTGNIPLSICNRSFLDVLDLSFNNFTGTIPRCLSNFTIVNLRKNSLEESIPDEFYRGALTQTLDVGYNRLTGKLPRSLLNCSSLRFLNVYHNRIEDTFPFWLKALPNLQALILRSNRFYGPLSPPDQSPLGFLELRVLEISDNNFTGDLPPNYFQNWRASTLRKEDGKIYLGDYNSAYYIYQDSFDFQYKGSFLEQSMVLAACATINFSGNRLEGQIPESIGLLKALIALNLSNNAFIGEIPKSLANLKELESLDLSSNQLSGNIPEGLGSLSFLANINVSHNQLKGRIPQGPQISGQPKSSFEGNAGLCGLPLEVSCFGTNVPQIQQKNQEDKEQVLNRKAMVIGYVPGVLLGLAIGQVIASYKPKLHLKINSFK